MILKKHLLFISYLILIVILIFQLFFSKKSVFSLFNNFQLIYSETFDRDKKLDEKNKKLDDYQNFKNNKEFRELIVKEKLFLKKNDDRVLLYEIID
tara:strand:+ start:1577 stop:1864 length:288 start_codon:yes stop_codon:yes gene_type:complete